MTTAFDPGWTLDLTPEPAALTSLGKDLGIDLAPFETGDVRDEAVEAPPNVRVGVHNRHQLGVPRAEASLAVRAGEGVDQVEGGLARRAELEGAKAEEGGSRWKKAGESGRG